MTRIRIKIAYDGTDFCGFQKLPGKRTVEGAIDSAASLACGEPISIIGASRTDSGVHALSNVAVFDTECRIPPERMAMAINARLPEDVRITASEACPSDWHPRKRASVKTYEYRIYNGRTWDPTRKRYSFFCPYSLDPRAMKEALATLRGTHDFTSFANPASQVLLRGGDAVRTIYDASMSWDEKSSGILGGIGEIRIRISGSGFLYHMVRIICGTVIEVGTGARKASDIQEILDARDRKKAGMTAGPEGLILCSIEYPDDQETDKRVSQEG